MSQGLSLTGKSLVAVDVAPGACVVYKGQSMEVILFLPEPLPVWAGHAGHMGGSVLCWATLTFP